MNLTKTLILSGVALSAVACSSLTSKHPPNQAEAPSATLKLNHVPYPAEAYLTHRITGDQATCAHGTALSAPVSLAVPIAEPNCQYHGAANAISLLTAYYGSAKAVCQVNEDIATASKPAGLPGCCGYICDSWRCDGGNLALDRGDLSFQEVIYNYYGLKSEHYAGLPRERNLRAEMIAGRPVIVKFSNKYPVRWAAVVGAIPPVSAAWRHGSLYAYQLADLKEGRTSTVGYGELRRHPEFGLATESWIGIIPAGRCQ